MTSTKNTLRPSRLFTLLLTLMLIGSTAACTQEPVEYFTPPPSTPTPTPVVEDVPVVFERPDIRTIAVPQYPQAANEISEDGARAFAYYFLKVLNYTAATGDVTHLEKLSGPRCTYCQHFTEVTDQIESQNGWTVGYDVSYRKEPSIAEAKGHAYAFNIDALSSAHVVHNKNGVQEELDEQTLIGSLVVYRLGDHWLVEEFGKGTV